MTSLRASLIVSTWNGRHLLETCLPLLQRAVVQAGGQHEIVVVDDASTDGTAEYVAREFPDVKVLALPRNLRFAGANNAAARFATGDILVFLNNDMLVEPDFLPPLLAPFDDPEVVAVTAHLQMAPRLVDGNLVRETGLVRGRFEGGFLVLRHDDPDSGAPTPVIYAGGGSSAWRRERFLDLGGFDTLFYPFYFEDLDVSYRAQKQGGRVLFAPRSRMEHKHRQTNNPKHFRPAYVALMFQKNSLLFLWKVLTDGDLVNAHFRSLWRMLMRPSTHPSLARAFLRAAWQLPALLVHRRRGRAGVTRTDAEVIARAAGEPRAPMAERGLPPYHPNGTGKGGLVAAAEVAMRACVQRRGLPMWGMEAANSRRKVLVIRAGALELTRELVRRVRESSPQAEVGVLAPEPLVEETRAGVGVPVLAAPGAGAIGYQLSRTLVRELRAGHYGVVFVAGEGNRRAEALALLMRPGRRVEVRDDGAAHSFFIAPYRPLLALGVGVVALLRGLGLSIVVGVVWGSIKLEGLVWRMPRRPARA